MTVEQKYISLFASIYSVYGAHYILDNSKKMDKIFAAQAVQIA